MTNTHRTSRQTHLTKAQIRALATLTLVFVIAIATLIQECATNRKDSTGQQSASAAAVTTIAADPTKTTVRFLDIGQGDSTIVELPDGKTMVIDAGPRGSAKTIEAQLKADGRPQVDYLVATIPMPTISAGWQNSSLALISNPSGRQTPQTTLRRSEAF